MVEITIKFLLCRRYTADVAASFPECGGSCHACCTCVSPVIFPPLPLPSLLLSSRDFAGENLHLHIETISKSIDRAMLGDRQEVQSKSATLYVLHASPCASFFFLALFPRLGPVATAVNKCKDDVPGTP